MKNYSVLLLLLHWLFAASAYSETVPEECSDEAIIAKLIEENIPVTSIKVLERKFACLYATGYFGAEYEDNAITFTLNSFPNSCSAEDLEKSYHGNSAFKAGILLVREAICTLARSDYNRTTSSEAEFDENERILQLLEKAQLSGLSPGYQNLASFLEGTFSCRQAMVHYSQLMAAPSELNLMPRIQFCQARRRAIGSISGTDFGLLDYRFTEDFQITSGVYFPPSIPSEYDSLDTRITSLMTQCYASNQPLDRVHNSTCGELSVVADHRMEEIADSSVSKVVDSYFGGSGPVSAMLNSKLDQVALPIQRIESKVTELETQSATVETKYNALSGEFESAFEVPLNIALSNYEEAYATIMAIDDWFHRWESGLLRDTVGKDRGAELEQRVQEIVLSPDQEARYEHAISSFKQQLKQVLEKPSIYKSSTLQLCRVLFCQMSSIDTSYEQAKATVCVTENYHDSPLCDMTKTFSIGSTTKNVQEICTESGFNPLYFDMTSTTDKTACLADLNEAMTIISNEEASE